MQAQVHFGNVAQIRVHTDAYYRTYGQSIIKKPPPRNPRVRVTNGLGPSTMHLLIEMRSCMKSFLVADILIAILTCMRRSPWGGGGYIRSCQM